MTTTCTIAFPLLVTGVSGVAGYNAFYYLRRRYPGLVVGIRPLQTDKLKADGIVGCDTEDLSALEQLFATHRFRSVLDTTGNCALKSCEINPDIAYRSNVLSAQHIAICSAHYHARLVHLSSDLVYSGEGSGGYLETDPPDPVSMYGKTMAQAETVVSQIDPTAAILRISLPMGPSFNRHAGAIDWIDSRFRAGRPATLYFDEVRSATYCDDLNVVFEFFLGNTESGLYHLGGPRAVTLNQIGQIVNKVGGYDSSLLRGCPRIEAGPIPPRAGNVSMNSEKLIRLMGYNPFRPWPINENHVPNDRDWHHRRDQPWTGSRECMETWLYRDPTAESVVEEILADLRTL
jgi:dTDP-4-dehydrorhamnose reductase